MKIPLADDAWTYRFSLHRVVPGKPEVVHRRFRPADILHMPKLTQLLAAAAHVKREVLAPIVEYFWYDQLKHYEECGADERERHIFQKLIEANAALKLDV